MTFDARGGGSVSVTRGLLRCGVAAGPLFITVFLLEGARRADYDPLRHPVSSLSLGERGWAQVANFSAAGALYVAGAAGLSRVGDPAMRTRLGSTLIAAAGLGLLGSAVFHTDPVSGYPVDLLEDVPGLAPDVTGEPSSSMTRHGMASIPIVVGLPAAAVAYAWRFRRGGQRRWALYSAGSAASMVVNFLIAAAGFGQTPRLVGLAGLFQRASIITAFTWISAVSARALTVVRPMPAAEGGAATIV